MCSGGKGAMVTARFAVDPSLWNTVVSVAVARVGGILVGATAPLGGYGTGNGGRGVYGDDANYGTAGGGGSSVALGVRDLPNRTLF